MSHRRCFLLAGSLALSPLLLVSAAAAPSISITTPPAGQPLYDVRCTITLAYASDDPEHPLALSTLSVTVNGAPWVSKFAVGPSSASYQITGDDVLVAGQLTIVASISDDAGTPATVSQTYEVFPTLTALVPATAQVGDTIVVRASGLDPAPSHNKLLLSPGGSAEFTSVDRANEEGTITIPPGTTSGAVQLEVNGKRSREKPILTVPSLIPNCGMVRDLLAMADGTWLVSYWTGTLPEVGLSSTCPLAWTTTRGNRWRVVKVPPGGLLQQVLVSGPNSIGAWNARFGVRVALNKERTKVAVATMNMGQEPGVMGAAHIYYDDHPMSYLLNKWLYAIDFDAEGNLYGLTDERWAGGGAARVYRLSRESLATGGEVTPEQIVDIPVSIGSQDFLKALVVSCDGFAYVGLDEWLDEYPFVRPHVFKVDLASHAVVADVQLSAGESQEELALSCHTNELWGARWLEIQESSKGDFWRADATGTGLGIPETIVPLGAVGWPFGVTVGPSGNLYFYTSRYSPSWGTAVLAKRAATEACPDVGTALPVCACPDGLTRGRDNTCGQAPLIVTSQTTRWKPQRADTPIEVHFTGPDDVNVAIPGRLEIRPPSPALPTTVTGALEVIGAGCTAGNGKRCYRLTWPGPWTYEDGGVEKPLPPGNYTVVVNAVAGTTPPLRDIASAPYDKVSLVEVKSVVVKACDKPDVAGACPGYGATYAEVGINPQVGDGLAVFPDAKNPGQAFRPDVAVKVEVEPPVEVAVPVYLRWVDVDDPSADAAPVDDETKSADNEADSAAIASPANAAGGPALTYFSVSTQQGNNYRVAASTHQPWLADLCGPVKSLTGEVRRGPCGTNPADGTALDASEARQVSDMLTVWRTLHVEMDKMAFPVGVEDLVQRQEEYIGKWTRIGWGLFMIPPVFGPRVLTDNTADFRDPEHPGTNDWRGATLHPHAPDPDVPGAPHPAASNPAATPPAVYFVQRNTRRQAVARSGDLRDVAQMSAPPGSNDRQYYLRDDEIAVLGQATHDLSFLERILKKAYIKIEKLDAAHAQNPNPSLPVTPRLEYASVASLPRDTANSPAFWAVPILLAFEGRGPANPLGNLIPWPTATHDPGPPQAGGVLGVTQKGEQPYSVTFVETLRDFVVTDTTCIRPTDNLTTVHATNQAHEVFHALSLVHDGGIMCSSLKNYGSVGHETTRRQLLTLRRLEAPFFEGRDVTCGPSSPPPPDCCPGSPPTCPQ